MKKLFSVIAALWLINTVVAQEESIGPIMRRPVEGNKTAAKITRAGNSIDSTFVYLTDTLTLDDPLGQIDDFSKSRFQQYTGEPGQPNVSEKVYYYLRDSGGVPFPADTSFTTTQTLLIRLVGGIKDTVLFPDSQIEVADFTTFPVNYTLTHVFPAYTVYDTLFPSDPDTVAWLPAEYFQDSVRIFTDTLHDPNALWLDSDVYHNYTMAVDPWTLGVATFDGLDQYGFPRDFGGHTSGVADYLTSKPFNLQGLGPADSVYLSFLVQRKGFGDEPEPEDSLVLELYDAGTGHWNHAWGIGGGPLSDFMVGHIRITNAMYLRDGFQFRFKNYGGLSGALDNFHLDYVKFRRLSGYQDTVFKDFAFCYPIGSLLKEYTQVPWDHWKNDPTHMNDSVRVTVRNGNNVAANSQNGLVTVKNNGTTEGTFVLNGQLLTGDMVTANYAARTTVTSYHNSAPYQFSTAIPGIDATFDVTGWAAAQFPNMPQNDSSFTQQYFGDAYAYDDGTAEQVYGITGKQARLAYQFTSYEVDSIIAIRMHFVPSVVDVRDNLFLLSVWNDNNGQPGSVLYEDEFFFPRTVHYENGYNEFTTYYLKDTMRLPVTSTFYIGWRQVDEERLNIGFDCNNVNSDKTFYSFNAGASWFGSSLPGSMMMRPVFATELSRHLGFGKELQLPEWDIYPNPTNGIITVKWENETVFPGATVRDSQGRMVEVMEAGQQTTDLSAVPPGLYFVQLNGISGAVKKIVRY